MPNPERLPSSRRIETTATTSACLLRPITSCGRGASDTVLSIIGFAQLLYDYALGPLNDAQRECLGDMLSCSDRLLMLISNVLDLAKIESGKMTFQYESVSPARLVREAMDTLQPIADSKRIEIDFQADPQVDAVQADSGRLKQILYNYLSNALKVTGKGGRINVSISAEDGGCYRIDVEDNGSGIAPEDIPRLFSEFGQLGAAEKSKMGCGLGLAICKRIAEAQGGWVGVESQLGKGSKFCAVLPRVREALASRNIRLGLVPAKHPKGRPAGAPARVGTTSSAGGVGGR